MQTITDEVGYGPIRAVTYAIVEEAIGSTRADDTDGVRLDSGERVVVPPTCDLSITSSIYGRREETTQFNFKSGDKPKGGISHTVDNGPNVKAANDNNFLARKNTVSDTKSYPLNEMYERGDLGNNEIENRCHWFDSQRFKQILADARCETDTSK